MYSFSLFLSHSLSFTPNSRTHTKKTFTFILQMWNQEGVRVLILYHSLSFSLLFSRTQTINNYTAILQMWNPGGGRVLILHHSLSFSLLYPKLTHTHKENFYFHIADVEPRRGTCTHSLSFSLFLSPLFTHTNN